MKTNIKMRVTPEQSRRVQEICFEKGILLGARKTIRHLNIPFLFIDNNITVTDNESFYQRVQSEQIDADLFIRTNGTCEEAFKEQQSYNDGDLIIKDDNIYMIEKTINKHYDITILEQKLQKKNEILKKARIKRKNQREELYKLNLKLQKCISFEEYNEIIDFKNQIIRELENENYLNKSKLHLSSLNNVTQQKEIEQLKVENTEMGKLVNLNKSALDLAVMTKDLAMKEIEELNKQIEKINKDNVNYLSDNILLRDKEIEKLKAVIEYLESKVK